MTKSCPRLLGSRAVLPVIFLAVMALAATALRASPFTFSAAGNLATQRVNHTSTLLSNGKVLVAGGQNSAGVIGSAEVFDPATGRWTPAGALVTPRDLATATLLPNGKVLVAGGSTSAGAIAMAELYDPVDGTWAATGSMAGPRAGHTATLLSTGKVLVAGGLNSNGYLASAELYDPASGTWSNTGSMSIDRGGHTAILLPNGKVLATAGSRSQTGFAVPLASAEIYDPATGNWTGTGSLSAPRTNYTATLLATGKVLVAGGTNADGVIGFTEIYDPASGSWSVTGSVVVDRWSHSATLLPNGKVLLTGGYDNNNAPTASAELYDPAKGKWTATTSLAHAREEHAATLLPTGKVLIVAGRGSDFLASTELYDPALGIWTGAGSLVASHHSHTATLLGDGRVLVAGGADDFGVARSLAELYDPVADTWSLTGSLVTARHSHTATLLPSGKVLVAGGIDSGNPPNPVSSAELFDPATGTWSASGSLGVARDLHTATLLPNGKVYVAGGETTGGGILPSAELYDPVTAKWSPTGNLVHARRSHTATLLPNGKVLLVWGFDTGSFELYDPGSGSSANLFTFSASLAGHTATLLPNGKVVIAGGQASNGAQPFAHVYDPGAGPTGALYEGNNLGTARFNHTATLLPNGRILVAGGTGANGALASAELFDPDSLSFPGTWTAGANLATEHTLHSATLLLNGKVLVAGGLNGNASPLVDAQRYDVGLGFNSAWQPQITTSPATAYIGSRLPLAGVRFEGISEASGGTNQNSSSNYPVAQLRNIDNSQISYFPVDPSSRWSDTQYTSRPLSTGVALGPSIVTVFTNGIPSAAKYLVVANPTVPTLVTHASPAVAMGVAIFDTASLAGGNNPTGVITFKVYGPDDGTCGGGAVFTSMITVSDNGTYQSASFTPVAPGVYRFVATYSGDGANSSAATACGDADESITVSPSSTATPTPSASPTGTPSATATPTPTATPSGSPVEQLLNISTRMRVLTGDKVLIGGFILTGTDPKKVIVRGLGPSLPVSGPLPDPTLELHDSSATLATNNNWKDTQRAEIEATTIAPSNDLESSIVATLGANDAGYTAILSGNDGGTGIGLVEVYDLAQSANSQLANISTRGFVDTGDNVMIGGVILGSSGTGAARVLVRAIGPSLGSAGVADPLQDPTLELRGSQGQLLSSNDNWRDNQEAAIEATGIAPGNDFEAAMLQTLAPGNYTAIVRGKNDTVGVALVELYNLP